MTNVPPRCRCLEAPQGALDRDICARRGTRRGGRAAPWSTVLVVVAVVVVVVVMVVLRKSPSSDTPPKVRDVLVEWNLKSRMRDGTGGPLIKNDAETIPRPPPGRRMPPLEVFNRTGQLNTPLVRWEPASYSTESARSCSLYATGDGVLFKRGSGTIVDGIHLPVGIMLTTRSVRIPSLCGRAVFVAFTLLPAATETVRTVLAQCADAPAPGIGVRSARVDRIPPSNVRIAVHPGGALKCGMRDATQEVWTAPQRRARGGVRHRRPSAPSRPTSRTCAASSATRTGP